MALTKEVLDDRIDTVGDTKIVHIRTATIIKEDGVELTRTFHRRTLNPGVLNANKDGLVDTDLSGESAEIQGVCNAVWTTDVKNKWRDILRSDEGL